MAERNHKAHNFLTVVQNCCFEYLTTLQSHLHNGIIETPNYISYFKEVFTIFVRLLNNSILLLKPTFKDLSTMISSLILKKSFILATLFFPQSQVLSALALAKSLF